MPMYDHECDDCGHTGTEFALMVDAPRIGECTACPKCGGSRYRRTVSVPSGAMEREYEKPIEMHSIAPVTDWEIEAFKRRHPGVDLTPDGVPLARTRKQKLDILRKERFEEKN